MPGNSVLVSSLDPNTPAILSSCFMCILRGQGVLQDCANTATTLWPPVASQNIKENEAYIPSVCSYFH